MTVHRAWTASQDRLEAARSAAEAALAAVAAGDPYGANEALIHAVHGGVWPADIVAEIVDQTGGSLP